MKAEKIKEIAVKEVNKLKRYLKLGVIDKNIVSFNMLIEGIVTDFNISKADLELLKEEVRQQMNVVNLDLPEDIG